MMFIRIFRFVRSIRQQENADSAYNYIVFVMNQGTIVFDHGETIKTINVEIIDDHQFEKDETFMIEITELKTEGAKYGRLRRTVVTIVSDDGKWFLS